MTENFPDLMKEPSPLIGGARGVPNGVDSHTLRHIRMKFKYIKDREKVLETETDLYR